MKYSTTTALLFAAASISIAVAVPAKLRYYFDDEEDSGEKEMLAPRQPYDLPTAPYYYQPRTMEVEEELPVAQRKYQIVRKKKKPSGAPQSFEDDEPQDDEEESSEEEQDEEGGGDNEEDEEESLDVPPWEELFPEEDKNTGQFDDQSGSGIGGGPEADKYLPGGAPAPESSGSFMSLFGFGGENSGSGSSEGLGGPGGPPPPQGGVQGGPPPPSQERGRGFGGPPPPPPPHPRYFNNRGRSYSSEEEEDDDSSSIEAPEPRPRQRSGGAVLFDGYRYIPVDQMQYHHAPPPPPQPQRRPKKVNKKQNNEKKSKKNSRNQQQQQLQHRSLPPSSSTPSKSTSPSSNKSNRPRARYVLVPFHEQAGENREIRFGTESGPGPDPMFAPTEIWRWEGGHPHGGRPLRRGDNSRPSTTSGIYFTPNPSRPHRGSPYIRFNDDESEY